MEYKGDSIRAEFAWKHRYMNHFVLYIFVHIMKGKYYCTLVLFASRFNNTSIWSIFWSSAVWNDMSTDKSLQEIELVIMCWGMCTVPKWLDRSMLDCDLYWNSLWKNVLEEGMETRGRAHVMTAKSHSNDDCKVTPYSKEVYVLSAAISWIDIHLSVHCFPDCDASSKETCHEEACCCHENSSHEKASRKAYT